LVWERKQCKRPEIFGKAQLVAKSLPKRVIPWVLWAAVFLGLYLAKLQSYLLFHSLAEIFSVVVAWSIFAFMWTTRSLGTHRYLEVVGTSYLQEPFSLVFSELAKAKEELAAEAEELRKALAEVRTLRGLLPICSHCKRVRDDRGYWRQLESYLREHSHVDFTHGVCPECLKRYYPEYADNEPGSPEER
jgi:hypothetical protein